MKKLIYVISCCFLSITTFAQAPQAFSYQAIAIGGDATALVGQEISVLVNVNSDNSEGETVYSETHLVTTSDVGLFTLEIGFGTPNTGSFDAIDWGSHLHFLNIAIDETGGTNYVTIGTSQLLSVPYALYAASGPQGEQGSQGEQGQQGDTGAQGETGPMGPPGEIGEQGAAGPQGDTGETGEQGPPGPKGDTGATGAQGPACPAGAQGPNGPQGPQGEDGLQGPPGMNNGGTNCWDQNNNFINDLAEDINQDGLFTAADCANPQGEQGPMGPQGNTGAQGPAGPQGDTGATGAQGPAGFSTPWNTDETNISFDGPVGIGTEQPACQLDVIGDVCANGIVLSSDARYKTDIVALPITMNQIKALRGVLYEFNLEAFPNKNFSNKTQIGLIAQEVEMVFPLLVTTKPDGYKVVDYAKMTPILLEAVKSVMAEMETEQTHTDERIEAIQAQLNELQNTNSQNLDK